MVTIAFVPREFVNLTIGALDRLIENTPRPFQLIAVVGGYPEKIVEEMRARVATVSGEMVEFDHFVTPNQARNTALNRAENKKIVFVDHDVFVEPGWLTPLLNCAEETDAAIVMPLIFEGRPACKRIHMAGGTCGIYTNEKGLRLRQEFHHLAHVDIDEVEEPLKRQETQLAEFHCVLVDVNWLRENGGLDEQLCSTAEHWDMSMQARLQGRSIFLEPASKVTYTPPVEAYPEDLRWFNVRWNDAWNKASIDRLAEKYDLSNSRKGARSKWRFLRSHQQLRFIPMRKKLEKRYGKFWGDLAFRVAAKPWQQLKEKPALWHDVKAWQNATRKTIN